MRVVTVEPVRRAWRFERTASERLVAHLEGLGIAAAAFVVLLGMWLAYRQHAPVFAETARGSRAIVDINRAGAEELAPALAALTGLERQREAAAIARFRSEHGPFSHVGALARVTTSAGAPLLGPAETAAVKPRLTVRTAAAYRQQMRNALLLFLAVFLLAHLVRRATGSTGDPVLLPAVMLLIGLSAAAMMSMRDPLRDTIAAASLLHGAAIGCGVLAALSFVNFENPRFKQATAPPLAAAAGLALLLLVLGGGPGGSGAKVNLLGMQPIEVIRLLAVLALASYFSRRWELLREVSTPVGPSPAFRRRLTLPRLRDILPLAIIVGTLLVFFVLQKDLGPALVLGTIGLGLYGVARGRVGLVLGGFAALTAGFAAGYATGIPSTVARRVAIWLDPWHNGLIGGDQIAHAHWALASGGPWGVGLGFGEGQLIPAGHTDLIIAVMGEELGFFGVLAVAALFGIIIWRILRIAERAPGDYTGFLAVGCALSLSVPALVIVAGLLGLMPLSGVVTPFLSYGKSSMIANMATLAIPLAIARRRGRPRPAFRAQIRGVRTILLGALIVLVGRAAWLQVVRADATTLRPSLVRQADGGARYQYNPRLLLAARQIPRGTIYDRNGLPLAVNDAASADPMMKRLSALRLTAAPCATADARCYPLGSAGFHLIGDATRQTNWAARNASYIERDAAAVLQGFDDRARTVQLRLADGTVAPVIERDYRALLPLVRGRASGRTAAVQRLLDRNRDVHVTLDGPLQLLVAQALAARSRAAGAGKGAAVVIDADSGAVLASASYPWPEQGAVSPEALLDRARYGLYPPGSAFKLITAAAALGTASPRTLPSFQCERLPDGRVGAFVRGVGRPVRDDVLDREPHGRVDLRRGLVVSCNAYFAQLAQYVGAAPLARTATAAGIRAASAPVMSNLTRTLPFAGYGQGEVLASPMRMARAVAAIAGNGSLREAPIVRGADTGPASTPWLSPASAAVLRASMRDVVQAGTGRALAGHPVAIAGKTGTAEVNHAASHSWFVGFAPAAGQGRRIAFAVIVEHAGYGGRAAAAVAADLVSAARTSGVIR